MSSYNVLKTYSQEISKTTIFVTIPSSDSVANYPTKHPFLD